MQANSRAQQRLARISNQIQPIAAPQPNHQQTNDCAATTDDVPNSLSKKLKWHGWGYNDTVFRLNSKGQAEITGNRYLLSGQTLPDLRRYMELKAGLDVSLTSPPQQQMKSYPPAIKNEAFLSAIEKQYAHITFADEDRLFHGHGHTCQELFSLRYGTFKRLPDVVIYPACHEHVEAIVKAAHEHNVAIIPFGGGTSVTYALLCPENEKRMIVSLDMQKMNKIKWINHKSMLACIEAGIIGKDLDAKLQQYGVCMGHEPDSCEFSSLGGWVATRASGMKKNKYGNIEDIVVKVTLVTPTGTFEKGCEGPRISAGPDINQIVMGSEGTLGVVTLVTIRLRPLPQVREFGSMVFPDFDSGVSCLHEIALKRGQPASIRLVDNTQFQFGQSLKPLTHKWQDHLIDKAKKWYVTQYRGFNVDKMVAATLVFEGTSAEVKEQERQVYDIAAKYGGMKAGKENGIRGYFLTYSIAYLRDMGFDYMYLSESFETSVPWDRVIGLCDGVKQQVKNSCAKHGVKGEPFVSCRVTQVYDTGACVYFYLAFCWQGLKDPVVTYSHVEEEARDEILRLGGSISHHHGVGKIRKHWMQQTQSNAGMELLKGIKNTWDPKNIFASGNLLDA